MQNRNKSGTSKIIENSRFAPGIQLQYSTTYRDSNAYLQSKRYHIAQSAAKERALLGIKPFWERRTLEPPLRWERGQIMLKLAILAKEGISFNRLREDPPDNVTLPPKPIYEANVENSTAQSERDRKTRNEQLKKT